MKKSALIIALLTISNSALALECSDETLNEMESKLSTIEASFDRYDQASRSLQASQKNLYQLLKERASVSSICESFASWRSSEASNRKYKNAFSDEIQSFENEYYSRKSTLRTYSRVQRDNEDPKTIVDTVSTACNSSDVDLTESQVDQLRSHLMSEINEQRSAEMEAAEKRINKKVDDYNKFTKACYKLEKKKYEVLEQRNSGSAVGGGSCDASGCRSVGFPSMVGQLSALNMASNGWGAYPQMYNPFMVSDMSRMYNPYMFGNPYMMPSAQFMQPSPFGGYSIGR